MEKVQKGDVIQINENHKWCGCLCIVSEVKDWGCLAGIDIPEQGIAYVRLSSDQYDFIGPAALVPQD